VIAEVSGSQRELPDLLRCSSLLEAERDFRFDLSRRLLACGRIGD
jgi:hypothetical protein